MNNEARMMQTWLHVLIISQYVVYDVHVKHEQCVEMHNNFAASMVVNTFSMRESEGDQA